MHRPLKARAPSPQPARQPLVRVSIARPRLHVTASCDFGLLIPCTSPDCAPMHEHVHRRTACLAAVDSKGIFEKYNNLGTHPLGSNRAPYGYDQLITARSDGGGHAHPTTPTRGKGGDERSSTRPAGGLTSSGQRQTPSACACACTAVSDPTQRAAPKETTHDMRTGAGREATRGKRKRGWKNLTTYTHRRAATRPADTR